MAEITTQRRMGGYRIILKTESGTFDLRPHAGPSAYGTPRGCENAAKKIAREINVPFRGKNENTGGRNET